MTGLKWDRLTEKQRTAWRMRYQYGWRMKRIALELGISPNGASKLVRRAHVRSGLPKQRISVIRTKPRQAPCFGLSEAFNV